MTARKKALAVVAGAVLAIIAINAVGSRATCAYYGYQTARNVKYAAFVGCLVETPSGWTPKAQVVTTQ